MNPYKTFHSLRTTIVLIALLYVSNHATAQQVQHLKQINPRPNIQHKNKKNERLGPDRFSAGFGLGLDYGGIGIHALYYPQTNIGFFVAGGYNFMSMSYNAGTKLRLFLNKSRPQSAALFITAMYGYNTVIKVEGAAELSKTFYGATVGLGIDTRCKRTGAGYWSFALLIPIRGSEVNNYMDNLKNNYGATMTSDLSPVAISVGHHFVFDRGHKRKRDR